MVRLQRFRNGKRKQIAAAAEGLIGVYDGRQLLPFGFDQDRSRVQEVTLGEEHFHVFGAGILKKFAGGVDGGLERFQLLLLDLDAPAVVLHHGHAVDDLGEGVEDDALVVVDGSAIAWRSR